MKRLLVVLAGLLLLGGGGFALAAATTGTVSVCATSPVQTISANGVKVGTITPKSACSTVTYTVPTATTTQTVTVTVPGTTGTTTTTPTTTSSGGGNVFLSTSGNDATCSRGGSPCATPAGAWAVAQSGDTISVAAGTYSSGCNLSGDKTAPTTFVGTGSAGTNFVCFLNLPAYAGLSNLGVYQFQAASPNVTLTNVDATCKNQAPYTLYPPDNRCSSTWDVEGSNFTWNGGSWGPLYDSSTVCNGNAPNIPTIGWNTQPKNVLIENVYAHDVTIGCSSQHTELARVDGGDVTFSRDFWHGCGNSACVYVSNSSGTSPNVRVVNTICDWGGNCIDFDFGGLTPTTGSLLENDTFIGGIVIDDPTTYTPGNLVVANTVWRGANSCVGVGYIAYHNNAPYQSNAGGTTDNCGDPNAVQPGNHSDNPGPPKAWLACAANCASGGTGLDFSVAPGSPLLHTGSASYLPATDYAGAPRPCVGQTQPNVGAYEHGCQ